MNKNIKIEQSNGKPARNISIGKISSNGKTSSSGKAKPILITGGAGFIGTNLAHRFLSEGKPVLLYDTLCRPGVEKNLGWLLKEHGGLVDIETADVRNPEKVNAAVKNASQVFHFA